MDMNDLLRNVSYLNLEKKQSPNRAAKTDVYDLYRAVPCDRIIQYIRRKNPSLVTGYRRN